MVTRKPNVRERIMGQTKDLRSTSDVPDSEIENVPFRPRTAPGTMQALANAERRIAELQSQADKASKVLVEKIFANPWQPRRQFAPAVMDELVASIRENGLLQPILLRPVPDQPDSYQIVAGERRWRAHKMLGIEDIEAKIVSLSDSDMAIHAMIENLHREGLTDYEVARQITRILNEFPSQSAAAEKIGISKSQMSRLVSYQKLPAFILTDLDQRPDLLGANAAQAVATAYAQNPEASDKHIEGLWIMLKQGEIDQAKLASLLLDRVNRKVPVSTRRHVKTYYAAGTKAGDLRRDASNFIIRLKTTVLTEEKEKQINEFLDTLFPSP